MRRSKLIKAQLVMGMNSNNFALRNPLAQIGNCLEKDWLVCSFKILMLLAIQESNEIRDGLDSESLSTVSSNLSIDCYKLEVRIFITFGSTLECWLDSHARRA